MNATLVIILFMFAALIGALAGVAVRHVLTGGDHAPYRMEARI